MQNLIQIYYLSFLFTLFWSNIRWYSEFSSPKKNTVENSNDRMRFIKNGYYENLE